MRQGAERAIPHRATYTPHGHIDLSPLGAYKAESGGTMHESPDSTPEKAKLLNRLARVEGHVRGIAKMVEEDRYCIEVLTQIQAARAALARVESQMLKAHLHHCIEGAIVRGDAEDQRAKARELIVLLDRAL